MIKKVSKEDIKAGQVKRLGAIKHRGDWLTSLPQIVLKHLVH